MSHSRRPLPLLVLFLALATGVGGQEPVKVRPGKHAEFADGLRELRYERWGAAATQMEKALRKWPEDGELTRIYGSWFEPYLPQLHFGVALYHLQCYSEALSCLKGSVLHQKTVRRAEEEMELLLRFEELAREKLRLAEPQPLANECMRWKEPVTKLCAESTSL